MNDNQTKSVSSKRPERGLFERPLESGIWWVCYFDEQGRKHRERVGSKALARKVYQKRKTEVQERRFFPERIRQRDVSLRQMIEDHLERAEAKLRHFYHYQRYGRYWIDALGTKPLRQIIPADIERYVAERIRHVKPATVNRELAFLKRVFNVAIADNLAEVNPVRRVKFFRENNQRVRFLAPEEEGQLREKMGEDEWPMVAFAMHTGFRQAEQFGLRWCDVDFTTGIITIERSKHGEVRRVPMNDCVRDILRSRSSRLKGEYVFPSQTGETPIDVHNYMSRVFGPALKKAGIENFHWHDLRHTFASRLVMKGVDIRTVQELLGHKTIVMTLRYVHLSPAHQLDAVQRLVHRASDTTTDTKSPAREPPKRDPAQTVDFTEKKKWAGSESNTRHKDFQSFALPTELPARAVRQPLTRRRGLLQRLSGFGKAAAHTFVSSF